VQTFKTKGAARFAKQERIDDAALLEAIERAERGLIDADLGGGLIKQRIARQGQGRSGGYRMIVAFMIRGRAVFLFGFSKSDRENIGFDELKALRALGATWQAASSEKIAEAIAAGDLAKIEKETA
jgi:hypothetical protein